VSNYLAVATVTATLRYMLLKSLPPDLSGASITTLRPDATLSVADAIGINIFLFRVSANPALRNSDAPTRRADGTLLQRPRVALDLSYLFTFYGNDADLEPQRLLGYTASLLNTQPVLSAEEIGQTLQNAQPFNAAPFTAAPFNAPPYQPDLAIQSERVNITMLPLSLEELSKLWSVFYQIPFALTMAYQASVVLIEREDLVPQSALPVTRRMVTAMTINTPVVTSVVAASGPEAPIVPGTVILILGSSLRGSGMTVQIGNYPIALTPTPISDRQMSVALPADVPAGLRTLQIAQSVSLGNPAVPHTGNISNAVGFFLRPVIATPVTASATQVTVNITPVAKAGQQALLLLDEATIPSPPTPAAYAFSFGALTADASSLTFPIFGVTGGLAYFVRVQIDGAESPLNLDSTSATYGPKVTIP
jgi:Pvc16 N-terminal domain